MPGITCPRKQDFRSRGPLTKLTEPSDLNLTVDWKWVTAVSARQQHEITPSDPYSDKTTLGSARFLKTIQGGSKAGPVVIKILVKPSPNLSFRPYIQALKAEQEALRTASNVFSYQCQLETDRAVYVVRQYFHASLYDRISTRPFLILVEKKFITFQLLRALADCHARKVCHGDIKTENVLVTSWNWAYLSDFASFKPTYLPEDNPGDFSFFFDTSSRRSCYLSPERFYDPVREPGKAVQAGALPGQSPGLHPSMDVFAMGCVIAELFLESSPTFLLSQLLSYKRGEYDPAAALQPIECSEIRSLVLHMIQSNPADRLSASEYLEKWCASGGAFPSYFSSFLYPYLAELTDASVSNERPELQSDARILKLAKEFDRISGLFGFVALEGEPEDQLELRDASDSQSSLAEEGAVLLGSVLMALTRSCALPSSQIKGLDMLLTSSVHLPDNLKLDRAIPYLLGLCFESSSGLVRAHSLTVLIQILASVTSLNPINFPLFSEYLLPHLRRLVNDPEVMVRVAYARNIAILAQVAARFARLTKEAASDVSVQSKAPAEDEQLGLLDQVVSLLIDPDSGVKRALLGSMPKLCVLFGHPKTNDVLLSHMITYLNDRDWMLRCSFFEEIVGVAEFVGRQSLEEYILPLMIQAITDAEEFVVEKVLCSLTSLACAKLFSKMTLWELITVVMPQLGHPNIWVRNAAASFASAASFHLTFVDQLCVLAPSMEPFLRYPPLEYPTTPADVVRALGTPIPRVIFDEALNWAAASPQMWDILQRRISKQAISVSGVDADWLRLLDSLRWTPFDEQRILAMRECIVKLAKSTLSSRRRINPSASSLGSEEPIHLQSLGVNPHTEFFSSPSANSSLHASASRNRPIEPNGTHRVSLRANHSTRLMSGRANSFHDGEARHLGIGELASRSRSFSSNSTLPDHQADSVNSPVPVILNLIQFNAPQFKDDKDKAEFQKGPDPRSFALNSSLRALLHKKESEAFPAPQADFGLFIPNQPSIPTQTMIASTIALKSRLLGVDRSVASRNAISTSGSWVPEGKLVTHLTEHKGAVNAVRVAPDHQFFVTGSDDGTVKVWDAHRLDRPITTRSRLTYFKLGGRVTCLTFLRNSYCVAAANDKGDIHIFRIELSPGEPTSTYSKCTTLRLLQLECEHALVIDHLASEDKSLLIFTTNLGNICCFDLRSSKLKWKVTNPLSHGTIMSFVIDPQANWLLVGTMKGVLVLWDLRFLVSLRHWLHPSQCPIRQLHAHSSRQVWVVAGRYNEVSLWDISQLECKRVVMASVSSINQLSEVSLKPLQVGSEEELLCCSLDQLEPPNAFPDHPLHPTTLALAVLGNDAIVTVGTDQTIRYFNLSRPSRSFHILPSVYVSSNEDSAVYRMVEHDAVPVLFESGIPASHSMESPRSSSNSTGTYKDYSSHNMSNGPDSLPRLSSRTYASTTSRSSVHPTILSHHHLLQRPHLDAITDVQLLLFPTSLLITADRSGVIKILL